MNKYRFAGILLHGIYKMLNFMTKKEYYYFENTENKIKKPPKKRRLLLWWAMRDSNPRPPRCKRGALNQLS